MKSVRVIFSPEAEEVYKYLNSQASNSKVERSILNAVHKKVELIKANIHYGNPVAKTGGEEGGGRCLKTKFDKRFRIQDLLADCTWFSQYLV